jgi:hypothetical protein
VTDKVEFLRILVLKNVIRISLLHEFVVPVTTRIST